MPGGPRRGCVPLWADAANRGLSSPAVANGRVYNLSDHGGLYVYGLP